MTAKGIIGGLGIYLTSKIPQSPSFFSSTEMKYFFISAACYPFIQSIFWDYMIEEETKGHYNKNHRKKLLYASFLYGSVAINPPKLKWLLVPMMIGKLIAFTDWIIQYKSFKRPQDIYLFGDGIWYIGFAMCFYQLYKQKK